MQTSILTTAVLPLALAFIMFGLGLHLRLEDFRNIARNKRSVIVALLLQMLLLPIACFLIAKAFGLVAGLAVGLMLLAVSPGGTSVNLYSFLFKGDVALNISLTAINSVLAVVTIPLFVNFALSHFMGMEQYIPLQF